MNWTELLKAEIESTYKAAEGLLAMVEDDTLDWKPATGSNWMTVGQLLMHTSQACGIAFRGFVTGDWGMPEGVDLSTLSPEEMLPPAEKLPAIASVAEAKKALADDKQMALEMLEKAGEERLATDKPTAPWAPQPMLLGHWLLQMVGHLALHKSQLFYYLKLQGKSVNTGHLFGM